MIPLFLTCGPNEVIVVSGLGHQKPALVTGGRIIVFPGLQTWQRMSLNVMTLEIASPGVFTLQGVPLRVTGIAQVKIASSPPELLHLACEHFLSKSTHQIMELVRDTLEGHQRGIMGSMTVEDIYKNRKLFNQRVFDVASKDLLSLGLSVLSYTIKDLNDDAGYLQVLGKKRTAEVMKDARMGEAGAKMESAIRQFEANEILSAQQYMNKTSMAEAERDYVLQKANFDIEVNTQKAISEHAYALQEKVMRQKIREEEIQMNVVSRAKKIEVEEEELKRKKKELEASIIQPALAEKYRMETIAAAERKKKVLEAEALAESVRLRAEASSSATLAMAKAESEQMANKAEAWEQYGEAAVLYQFLETLPKIAHEVGRPLSSTKSVKMVSSGDSDVGAAKLAKEVSDITASIPQLVTQMTGVEFNKRLEALQKRNMAVRH